MLFILNIKALKFLNLQNPTKHICLMRLYFTNYDLYIISLSYLISFLLYFARLALACKGSIKLR